MALQYKDLLTLMKVTAKADIKAPIAYSFNDENFSYTELNDLVRDELNALACDYKTYRKNKDLIFELMESTIDEVLPRRVMEQYSMFAEIRQFKQGQKPIFTQRITTAARRRARQFIGKVGIAGRYEIFKLDGKSYEVTTNAVGGAAQIAFEEFLDGRVNMADVLDIVLEGLDSCVYVEIERQLKGAVSTVQAANKETQTSFDEAAMDGLISIAGSYGRPVIYCTFEFAATMVPSDGWVSNEMKNAKWDNGYLANYKGNQVIVLPQSYEDETNEVKVIDPRYAWIIPTGSGNEKPVKIAFEGETIVEDYKNRGDRSMEVQIYKKMGVVAIFTPNICVYENTSLTRV